jgi:hypothetical protein
MPGLFFQGKRMYPLNLIRPTSDHSRVAAGFAVANDADEHAKLSALGYEPKFVAPADVAPADPGESDAEGHTVASVRLALDKLGIEYSNRLGLAKLIALLPA